MPHRSAETATYPGEMAKVELVFPDDILRQIDEAADRAEESRDAFMRRSIEEEVVRNQDRVRKELWDLWARHTVDLGGKTAAELVRETRDSR